MDISFKLKYFVKVIKNSHESVNEIPGIVSITLRNA